MGWGGCVCVCPRTSIPRGAGSTSLFPSAQVPRSQRNTHGRPTRAVTARGTLQDREREGKTQANPRQDTEPERGEGAPGGLGQNKTQREDGAEQKGPNHPDLFFHFCNLQGPGYCNSVRGVGLEIGRAGFCRSHAREQVASLQFAPSD